MAVVINYRQTNSTLPEVRDRRWTTRLDLRGGVFERSQLIVTVRTPNAAIEGNHELTLREEYFGTDRACRRVREGELRRDISDVQCSMGCADAISSSTERCRSATAAGGAGRVSNSNLNASNVPCSDRPGSATLAVGVDAVSNVTHRTIGPRKSRLKPDLVPQLPDGVCCPRGPQRKEGTRASSRAA